MGGEEKMGKQPVDGGVSLMAPRNLILAFLMMAGWLLYAGCVTGGGGERENSFRGTNSGDTAKNFQGAGQLTFEDTAQKGTSSREAREAGLFDQCLGKHDVPLEERERLGPQLVGNLFRLTPPNSRGIEVGVWKGRMTGWVLSALKPSYYALVDPWRFQPEFPTRMFGGTEAGGQADMDAIFSTLHDKVQTNGWDKTVQFFRKNSSTAAHELPNDSFDWAYIDGNHYYEWALEDLRLYAPKIKAGGYLMGDDYNWKE
jgi:hypothetical protein